MSPHTPSFEILCSQILEPYFWSAEGQIVFQTTSFLLATNGVEYSALVPLTRRILSVPQTLQHHARLHCMYQQNRICR